MAITSDKYRSSKIKELISSKPEFLITYGNILIILFAILLISFSWFIPYPDSIRVSSTIAATDTSRKLILVKRGDRFKNIFVKDREQVVRGDTLGYLDGGDSYKALIKFSGELDSTLALIRDNKVFEAVKFLDDCSIQDGQINSIYSICRQNINQLNGSSKNIYIEFIYSIRKLVKELMCRYIITAPIDGKVFFVNPFSGNTQFRSEIPFCVIKPGRAAYYARVEKSENIIHKIKTGQVVILHIPSDVSGHNESIVKGCIESITEEQSDNIYNIKIFTSDEKIKTTKKEIIQIEILTNNKRLLQKLTENLLNRVSF